MARIGAGAEVPGEHVGAGVKAEPVDPSRYRSWRREHRDDDGLEHPLMVRDLSDLDDEELELLEDLAVGELARRHPDRNTAAKPEDETAASAPSASEEHSTDSQRPSEAHRRPKGWRDRFWGADEASWAKANGQAAASKA